MTVINSTKDTEALALTFVSEFAAPVERVWQLWEDPRQLERWWGPPGYPATFVRHEFHPGGQVSYYMTFPDGTQSYGWWTITAVEPPHRLELDDGFAGSDGVPVESMPSTHMTMTLEPTDNGTRMTLLSTFASLEQLESMAAMGMVEGMTLALGQIDDLLVSV